MIDEVTAEDGHEKWLPKKLKDVTNNTIYKREYFE
jgi:hypothetical protein